MTLLSESHCTFNPSVMHALYIIEGCKNDLPEAKKLASLQLQCCGEREFHHWMQVYAVLNGESGGRT